VDEPAQSIDPHDPHVRCWSGQLEDPVQQVHQAMWRPQYPSFEAI
jgi:hypothetical protein